MLVAIIKTMMSRNDWMRQTCRRVHVEAMDGRLLTQLVDHWHLEQVLHHELLIGRVHLEFLHVQFALLHVERAAWYFSLGFLVFCLGHVLMRTLSELVQYIRRQVAFLT